MPCRALSAPKNSHTSKHEYLQPRIKALSGVYFPFLSLLVIQP